MKKLLPIIMLMLANEAMAGTCSSISRTNASANSVLTSTKYNADLNTSYSNQNAYDGGCITDSTLELASADSSWDPLKNDTRGGCKIEYSSASSVTVGACLLEVDGEMVNTSTTTTLSMGCGDCSSETSDTEYYIYAKDGSSGSTLNLFFSTTEPTNGLGEDGSNNKIIGKLYNGTGSDIEASTIKQWGINGYTPTEFNQYLGHVRWQETTNCNWTTTSATYADFPADADCDDNAREIYGINNETTGTASDSDGQTPKIELSGLKSGVYTIHVTGGMYAGTGTSCHYRISDGSNHSQASMVYSGGSNPIATGFVGVFIYENDPSGTVTFTVQGKQASGSNGCYIVSGTGLITSPGLSINVYYSPIGGF